MTRLSMDGGMAFGAEVLVEHSANLDIDQHELAVSLVVDDRLRIDQYPALLVRRRFQ